MVFNLFEEEEEKFGAPIENPYVKDGDTVENIRLKGINTLEKGRIIGGDDKPLAFQAGQIGGEEASLITKTLVEEEGFNIPYTTGRKDKYDRFEGDMYNPDGQSLSNRLLEIGSANLTPYSSKEQIGVAMQGRLDRAKRRADGTQDKWDKVGDAYINFLSDNQELRARQTISTERDLANVVAYLQQQGKDLGLDDNQLGFFVEQQMADLGVTDYTTDIRRLDRNVDNTARNTISTALALGGTGIMEGMYGTWDMLDDLVGWDSGAIQEVERLRREKALAPILPNQNAFDEKGNWRLDSASQIGSWLLTNMAISAPYMLQTIVATMAAPATFGVSLAFPAATYTGQTYNEQEEKNPLAALGSGIGMTALDILGISGFLPKSQAAFFLQPEVRKRVVKEVAYRQFDNNIELAEAAVANATMTSLAQVSKAAKKAFSTQLGKKYLTSNMGKAFFKGGAEEALTEAGQELLGALGEKGFDLSKIDGIDLQNRLLNASVAGFGLGGTMSSTGAALNHYQMYAAVEGQVEANLAKADSNLQERETLKSQGYKPEQLSNDALVYEAANAEEEADLNEIAAPEMKRREEQGVVDSISRRLKQGVSSFFTGYMNNLNNRFGTRGIYMKKLMSLMGGNRIFHGNTLEENPQMVMSQLLEQTGTQRSFEADMNAKNSEEASKVFLDSRVQAILNEIASMIRNETATNFNEAYDILKSYGRPELTLPQEYTGIESSIINWGQKFHNYEKTRQDITGETARDGDFYNRRGWKKAVIAQNPDKFKEGLMEIGYSATEANDIYRDIMDLNDMNTVDDVVADVDMSLFDKGETRTKKGIDKETVMKNKILSQFMSNDLFYNMNADASSTAARVTERKYIKGGKVQAYFIKKALEAGEISETEAAELAAEIKDYLAIRKGTYKRIENETARAFQNNMLLLTTLNQLSLAAVSSIVELALITNSIPRKLLFSKDGIAMFARKAAAEIFNYYDDGVSTVFGKPKSKKMDAEQQDIFSLGFLQESTSVAHRQDINIGQVNQKWIDGFFKVTGLQAMTNFTRSVRLALGGDAIRGFLDDIAYSEGVNTKQSLFAKEYLSHLGMDYDTMLELHQKAKRGESFTDTEQTTYEDNIRRALFNFVNDAVAHPTKANRPKFYQNPRFALFFQFQGFIATFTSTILPRIYKNAFKGNTPPAARMDAIATMASLLAMGFFAMTLKDLIKFGEEPDWLEDDKKFLRALYASGLLGTGERIAQLIAPVYDTKSDGWMEAALDEITGQAPVLGYAGRIGQAANEMTQALFDIEREGRDATAESAAYKTLRAAPVVGPFTEADKGIAKLLFGD